MRKTNDHRKGFSLVGIVLGAIIVGLAVFSWGQSIGVTPMSKLVVYAAGVPDSYGDRIFGFYVYQNTSGSWTQITSVEYNSFTNGTTLSIPANQKTIVLCLAHLNVTFAPDASTALTRTRVYITISGIVSSTLMTASGSAYDGLYNKWGCSHWYPSSTSTATSVWTPTTDTTYTVTIQYQAYY